MELRCEAKLYGIVIDDHTIEVKCGSKFCGASSRVVVMHKFDLHTGAVETTRYKAPPVRSRNDTASNGSAVRNEGRQTDASC